MSEELVTLLADLVAIPSINPMGGTRPPSAASAGSTSIVDFVEAWLVRHGIACGRQPVPGEGENLIATLPGPPGSATLIFDAHTDTVPAEDWADRAFRPRVNNGRLYGRGACDAKGSLAAMMWALQEAGRTTLPHSVILLASADEEYGRTGLRAYLGEQPAIDHAVVGEPTDLVPVVACKGAARWDIVVEGRSAHTSSPRGGINAIVRMAAVIRLLEEYERTVLAHLTHPLTDPPSLTPAVIHGGTAINVVPASCGISLDLRTLPGTDPMEVMRDVQAFLAARCPFPLRHERVQIWPGADTPPGHAFVQHCLACCRAVLELSRSAGQPGDGAPDDPPRPGGVNFGCHASEYTARGLPAVVLGPGGIAAAHAVDEYVELHELNRAAAIYHRIMITPISEMK